MKVSSHTICCDKNTLFPPCNASAPTKLVAIAYITDFHLLKVLNVGMKFYFLLILSLLSKLASGYCKTQLPSFASARTLQMPKEIKSAPISAAHIANAPAVTIEKKSGGFAIPESLKLAVGAGGIYAAFLYYGALQEDVFHYKAVDGTMFKQAWFLQALGGLLCEVLFVLLL